MIAANGARGGRPRQHGFAPVNQTEWKLAVACVELRRQVGSAFQTTPATPGHAERSQELQCTVVHRRLDRDDTPGEFRWLAGGSWFGLRVHVLGLGSITADEQTAQLLLAPRDARHDGADGNAEDPGDVLIGAIINVK